jgi:hypothetical protein
VKLEADREAAIRAIFRESQAPPTKDYLFNYGQRRVLAYELPRDEARTIALCGRLFREVFEKDRLRAYATLALPLDGTV